jgi:hypothetical protein
MTPDEQARLQAHTAESPNFIQKHSPRGIKEPGNNRRAPEKTWIEIVGPQVAFFYQRNNGNRQRTSPNSKKLCG